MTFSPEQLALLQRALTPPAPSPAVHAQTAEPMREAPRDPLPLWPLLAAYPLFAALLGGVSLLAPASLLPVALVASPALLLPLAVHALVAPHAPRACQALALACALLFPPSVWLARPWLLWLAGLSFSCFFALAAPRGVLARASAWACGLVLLAGGLVLARAPARLVWPPLVLAITLQSVAATARLRTAALSCAVVDAAPRAPSAA